jgi:AraC family transcriptional regulator
MIVSTRFPDLPPRPETAANASFRREYFARWGRENMIFLASTRRFEAMPLVSALSVKMIESGSATFHVGRRRVVLEPGACLVVNEGDAYALDIASDVPVRAFSLHFRPGLGAEVAQARSIELRKALDFGNGPMAGPAPQLRDELHAPTPALLAAMDAVRQCMLGGERAGDVFESLFIGVLDRMLSDDSDRRQRANLALHAARPATRNELLRRAGWAHDFILSNYAEPMALDQIAAAAHLSKFHLLRVFHQAYGATPLTVLRARRAQAAAAMLQAGAPDLAVVAESVGFGSRWAMQRALRQHCGTTGRGLRQSHA